MASITDLKERVESLAGKQEKLDMVVAGISRRLGQREKSEERICIYFEKRDKFVKAIHYLQDQNVHIDVIGCGAFLSSVSAVDMLKSENFEFGTARNPEEFYKKNTELVKKWRKQVRQYYGLS